MPWRATTMLLVGVTPRSLALYQRLLMASIMFHHSNVRLPHKLERWLSRLIMTSRLHGIHHSTVEDEANSNWSGGLIVWLAHVGSRSTRRETDTATLCESGADASARWIGRSRTVTRTEW